MPSTRTCRIAGTRSAASCRGSMWSSAPIGMGRCGCETPSGFPSPASRRPQGFGTADPRDLIAVYRRAGVGFNYSIANDVNMRIFEVLAAETLLVTNALASDDLRRLGLEDRRHLVLYRRTSQVFDLIDHYLAHPDEREAIAASGAAVVRQRHTYVHRMRQLLMTVSRRLGVALPAHLQELTPCGS